MIFIQKNSRSTTNFTARTDITQTYIRYKEELCELDAYFGVKMKHSYVLTLLLHKNATGIQQDILGVRLCSSHVTFPCCWFITQMVTSDGFACTKKTKFCA